MEGNGERFQRQCGVAGAYFWEQSPRTKVPDVKKSTLCECGLFCVCVPLCVCICACAQVHSILVYICTHTQKPESNLKSYSRELPAVVFGHLGLELTDFTRQLTRQPPRLSCVHLFPQH